MISVETETALIDVPAANIPLIRLCSCRHHPNRYILDMFYIYSGIVAQNKHKVNTS